MKLKKKVSGVVPQSRSLFDEWYSVCGAPLLPTHITATAPLRPPSFKCHHLFIVSLKNEEPIDSGFFWLWLFQPDNTLHHLPMTNKATFWKAFAPVRGQSFASVFLSVLL